MNDDERAIVSAVRSAVGPRPVLLCGSRATGRAAEASDWDVLVVLPLWRVPFAMARLGRARGRLEQRLGAQVSLNLLPQGLLRRPDNLFRWKLRTEARQLDDGPRALDRAPGARPAGDDVVASLLLSAAVAVLRGDEAKGEALLVEALGAPVGGDMEEEERVSMSPPPAASDLREAAPPGGADMEEEERLSMSPPTAASDLREAAPPGAGDVAAAVADGLERHLRPGAFRRKNALYVALSALRGRQRLQALVLREPVDLVLARAAVALLRGDASTAAGELPRFLRGRDPRSAVLEEFESAHPLVAL